MAHRARWRAIGVRPWCLNVAAKPVQLYCLVATGGHHQIHFISLPVSIAQNVLSSPYTTPLTVLTRVSSFVRILSYLH